MHLETLETWPWRIQWWTLCLGTCSLGWIGYTGSATTRMCRRSSRGNSSPFQDYKFLACLEIMWQDQGLQVCQPCHLQTSKLRNRIQFQQLRVLLNWLCRMAGQKNLARSLQKLCKWEEEQLLQANRHRMTAFQKQRLRVRSQKQCLLRRLVQLQGWQRWQPFQMLYWKGRRTKQIKRQTVARQWWKNLQPRAATQRQRPKLQWKNNPALSRPPRARSNRWSVKNPRARKWWRNSSVSRWNRKVAANAVTGAAALTAVGFSEAGRLSKNRLMQRKARDDPKKKAVERAGKKVFSQLAALWAAFFSLRAHIQWIAAP